MSTKFASAVAAVRAMENTLLSQADAERMASAEDETEIADILTSLGRNSSHNKNEMLDLLDKELEAVWRFISDYAPKNRELEILIYRNNFHNLKAALKALVTDNNASELFIMPTSMNTNELMEIISTKKYEMLPEYMRETAEKAYDVLTRTLDSQLTDALIDTSALFAMKTEAYKNNSTFMQKYAELITMYTDIKTAYRCSIMQKSKMFLETAICGSDELDKASMVNAALNGTDNLISYLKSTSFHEVAEILSVSGAEFEKMCDYAVISLAEEAKMRSFGIAPLAAYYITKEMEIKNLRILIVCKSIGISEDKIKERLRRRYV